MGRWVDSGWGIERSALDERVWIPFEGDTLGYHEPWPSHAGHLQKVKAWMQGLLDRPVHFHRFHRADGSVRIIVLVESDG